MKRASIIQCAEVLKYNDPTCCCAVCRDTHARNPAVDTMSGCAEITFALPVLNKALSFSLSLPVPSSGPRLQKFVPPVYFKGLLFLLPRPNPWCVEQRPLRAPEAPSGDCRARGGVLYIARGSNDLHCSATSVLPHRGCSATPRICTLTLVCACAGALAGMAALQFSDIRCARAPHTCCMPHLSCYTPLTLSVFSVPSVLHQALRVTRLHVHHRTALLREHIWR